MFPYHSNNPFYDLNAYNRLRSQVLNGQSNQEDGASSSNTTSPPHYSNHTVDSRQETRPPIRRSAIEFALRRSPSPPPQVHQPHIHHQHMHEPHMHHQHMHHQHMHQPHSFGPYDWHTPSHHHQHAYSSETIGTRKISIVDSTDRTGCVITCIAMIANISYQKARALSLDYWSPDDGMLTKDAKYVLEHLGIESRVHDQDSETSWSDLPDLAIVAVRTNSENHAVVFGRTKDGRELIFDTNNHGPVSCYEYKLLDNNYYVEIL